MKAVVVRNPSGLGQVQVVNLQNPGQQGPSQIRVALHASTLAFIDLRVANGTISTSDGRVLMAAAGGLVEAVDSGVSKFKPSDNTV